MTVSPTISVIIPAYNAETSIERAISSVIDQTVQADEIIVIDDGSTDSTRQQVERFGEQVCYVYQDNAGSSAARNHGLRLARGEWVAFLDADDAWHPEKTRLQLALLAKHPKLAWVSGGYVNVQNGNVLSYCKTPHKETFLHDDVADDALELLGARWSIWTGTVMVRQSALADVGDFDEEQRTSHDLDLWIRIATRHPRLGWVTEPIAAYELNNPVGLTKTSISTNDQSLLALYERAVRQASQLHTGRRHYIMQFVAWHSTVLLREVIRGGYYQQAGWLLQHLKRMNVPVPLWLDWATRFTPKPFIPVYRWFSIVRARLRVATT